MKNCIQTLILSGADPKDLQENLNTRLIPLGDNVKSIEVISSGHEYMAVVSYFDYNFSIDLEQQIEELEGETNHDPIDPIRALVMFGSEYDKAAIFLQQYKDGLEFADSEAETGFYKDSIQELDTLIKRFKYQGDNSQGD